MCADGQSHKPRTGGMYPKYPVGLFRIHLYLQAEATIGGGYAFLAAGQRVRTVTCFLRILFPSGGYRLPVR